MTRSELYEKAMSLPTLPGCYIMRDEKKKIIYIGKAKRLKIRVGGYFRDGAQHDAKVAKMVATARDFDVIVTDSEYEALVLECSLIKQNKPQYNILLKDDKGFSYIRVSAEEYPRITSVYKKENDGATYLGPYYSAFAAKRMVDAAVTSFGLPTCRRQFPREIGKERPCLNAHIGRCSGVCSGKISRAEYQQSVGNAVTLLTKGSREILKKLKGDMEAASEALEFERAARLRDSILAIQKTEDGQKVIKEKSDEEMDVFAFAGSERNVCAVVLKFREGKLNDKDEQVIYDTADINEVREEFVSHYYITGREAPKKILLDADFESREAVERMLSEQRGRSVTIAVPKRGDNHALAAMAYNNAAERLSREGGRKTRNEAALGELANMLGLDVSPKRIESYDISNYGDEAVAGMAVFINGLPRRYDYRRFIIKTVDGVDDYASMSEALSRRAARLSDGSAGFAERPDVIFVDGGRGHLAASVAALEGTALEAVPIFGLVKDDKHRTRGIVSRGGELDVLLHKAAFSLVTKIQNETHRYTVEYQRERHSKTSFKSSLTEIDGIGEIRAKAALKHFKTLEAVKKASVEELLEVKGMTSAAAKAIYGFYRT